jgi:hypothetical protein
MIELGFLSTQKTGSLFHYTDVAAVMSIIKNRCLRLTDYRYLNDSSEYHDGISNLKGAFNILQPSVLSNYDYFGEAASYVKNFLDDDAEYPKNGSSIYVGSFSRSRDQLSQWRSYGSYAIEFDREELSKSFALDDCVYDPIKKKKHSSAKVSECLERVSNAMSLTESFNVQAQEAYSMLIREALIFKHEAFHEENEVRCVVGADGGRQELKFRHRGDMIIPYIEVPFELKAVRAIHIGPIQYQELAASSMASYLGDIQFGSALNIFEEDYINIVRSSAPFRTV